MIAKIKIWTCVNCKKSFSHIEALPYLNNKASIYYGARVWTKDFVKRREYLSCDSCITPNFIHKRTIDSYMKKDTIFKLNLRKKIEVFVFNKNTRLQQKKLKQKVQIQTTFLSNETDDITIDIKTNENGKVIDHKILTFNKVKFNDDLNISSKTYEIYVNYLSSKLINEIKNYYFRDENETPFIPVVL